MGSRPRVGAVLLLLLSGAGLLEGAVEAEDAAKVCDADGCDEDGELSLRQLRAQRAAMAAEAPPQLEEEAAPPSEDDEAGPPYGDDSGDEDLGGPDGDEASFDEPLPGGWGEAANYTEQRMKQLGVKEGPYDADLQAESQWWYPKWWENPRYHRHHSHGGGHHQYHQTSGGAKTTGGKATGGKVSRVLTLYHNTSPNSGRAILRSGFRPGRYGWCLGGIYFATSPGATLTKAIGPDSHQGFMLEAKVDVGKSITGDRKCKVHGQRLGSRILSMGYDSMTFNPGDGTEYVVYSGSRVLSVRHIPFR